jgi:hypothetical protein
MCRRSATATTVPSTSPRLSFPNLASSSRARTMSEGNGSSYSYRVAGSKISATSFRMAALLSRRKWSTSARTSPGTITRLADVRIFSYSGKLGRPSLVPARPRRSPPVSATIAPERNQPGTTSRQSRGSSIRRGPHLPPARVGRDHRTNSLRSLRVSRSAPLSVTSTVSLNARPCADTYMWKTMPGSSTHVAVGTNRRVKSLVRGDHGA